MGDDDSGSAKKKSNKTHRSGGELGDDEPKLDGYERYVVGFYLMVIGKVVSY